MNRRNLIVLRYTAALCLFLAGQLVWAQQRTLKGKVTDGDNIPMPGATIVVDGAEIHTTTDPDGNFELSVPGDYDGTFTVQFLGYSDETVPVTSQSFYTVTMELDRMFIDEAVVQAGYGTMRKSDITGSLTSVIIDDAVAARATSLDQLLSGRAAGVSVISGNAAPGGAVKIRIRGTGSLRGDSEPLYVVDGSIIQTDVMNDPLQSYGQNKGNASIDNQNPLSMINPQDIQSIEVLKDAASTAIYGSRASNGIVLITTKEGVVGQKPQISQSLLQP